MDLVMIGFSFCAGVAAGWTILPQPQWVRNLLSSMRGH